MLQVIDDGDEAPCFYTTDLYGNRVKELYCKWPRQQVVWHHCDDDFPITGFGLASIKEEGKGIPYDNGD